MVTNARTDPICSLPCCSSTASTPTHPAGAIKGTTNAPLARSLCHWRDSRHCRDDVNRIRVELQELVDDDVWLEADGVGVGANEATTKNADGPVRDLISLQRFQ